MVAAVRIERPLDAFEAAFYSLRDAVRLNVVLAVRLRGALPAKALRPALDALQQAHPLLHARVEERADGPWWTDAPDAPPLSLEVRTRAGPHAWVAAAEDLLDGRFDLARGGGGRVAVLEGREEHDVVIALPHLVSDGATMVAALRQLLLGAERVAAGAPPGLPPQPAPPPLAALAPFRHGSPEARRVERAAARRLLVEALLPRKSLRIDAAAPADLPSARRRTRLVPRELGAATTQALAARCREERTTITGLLGAAYLLAAAEEAGPGRYVLSVAVNLRNLAPQAPRETLSFYDMLASGGHRVRPGASPWALARRVRATLEPPAVQDLWGHVAGLERRRAAPPPARPRRARAKAPATKAGLVVTNLGRVEGPEGTATWTRVFLAPTADGLSLPIVLGGGSGQDGLAFNLAYPEPLFAPGRIHDLADRVRDLLERTAGTGGPRRGG